MKSPYAKIRSFGRPCELNAHSANSRTSSLVDNGTTGYWKLAKMDGPGQVTYSSRQTAPNIVSNSRKVRQVTTFGFCRSIGLQVRICNSFQSWPIPASWSCDFYIRSPVRKGLKQDIGRYYIPERQAVHKARHTSTVHFVTAWWSRFGRKELRLDSARCQNPRSLADVGSYHHLHKIHSHRHY